PLTFARGRGALQAWFDFEDGAPVALTADIKAVHARLLVPPLAGSTNKAPPPLDATELSGRLSWSERTPTRGDVEQHWAITDLRIQPSGHADALATRGEWTLEGVRAESGERQWRATRARIDAIDLGVASRVVEGLPIPALWRERLIGLSARGLLRDVVFSARIDHEEIDVEHLSARLDGVGWNAFEHLPGVAGLAGKLDIRTDGGALHLELTPRGGGTSGAERQLAATRPRVPGGSGGPGIAPLAAAPRAPLTLTLPRVFEEPIVLTQLAGLVRWSSQPVGLAQPGDASARPIAQGSPKRRALAQVVLEDVRFATPHASGRIAGTWQPDALGPGIADLSGTLATVRVADVHRYLPLVVEPHARRWIEGALRDGLAHDTQFRLKGALWHFPFHDAREGEFEVTTRAEDVTVDYADHWPPAERVNAVVTFRGPGLVVQASHAQLNGTPVGPVEVKIDDMAAATATVDIRGSAQADLAQFLAFAANSPVERMLGGFTRGAEGSGSTRLELSTSIPLQDEGAFQLQGELVFEGARIDLAGEAPLLTDVRGRLAFDRTSVRDSGALTASTLGGAVSIGVTSDASALRIQARGHSKLSEVGAYFASPLVEWIDGTAEWTLGLAMPLAADAPTAGARDRAERTLEIAARIRPRRWPLDEVFGETRARDGAAQPIELRLVRSVRRDGTDRVDLALGDQMQVAAERGRADASGVRRIERALVELGKGRGALPVRGVALRGEAAVIDVDRAAAVWAVIEPKLIGSVGRPADAAAGSTDRLNVNLRAREAVVLGHRFHDVSFRAQPAGQRWRLAVNARETSG
ncbi:MAG: YhdP family protein, partial [Casimicrobiaceae bacterium]